MGSCSINSFTARRRNIKNNSTHRQHFILCEPVLVSMIGGNYSYSSGGRGLSFGAVIEEGANGYNNQLLNGHSHSSASRSMEHHVVRRPSVDDYLSSQGFNMYDYVQRKQIKDSNDLKRPNHEANLYCACDRHLRRRLTSSES